MLRLRFGESIEKILSFTKLDLEDHLIRSQLSTFVMTFT